VIVAASNSLGQVGSFLFPWLWGLSKDATGSFHAGMSALPLAFVTGAVIVMSLRQARRRQPARARMKNAEA